MDSQNFHEVQWKLLGYLQVPELTSQNTVGEGRNQRLISNLYVVILFCFEGNLKLGLRLDLVFYSSILISYVSYNFSSLANTKLLLILGVVVRRY